MDFDDEHASSRRDSRRRRRMRAVRRRWFDIGAYAVLATAIVLASFRLLRGYARLFTDEPVWMFVSVAVCIAAVAIAAGSGRWLAFLGLRHAAHNPPAWVASLGSGAAILLLLGYSPRLRSDLAIPHEVAGVLHHVGIVGLFLTSAIACVAVITLARAGWWRPVPEPLCESPAQEQPAGPLGRSTFEQLRAANLDPLTMLPQIAWFLVERRSSTARDSDSEDEYKFDEERARMLFSDLASLLALFEPEDPSRWAGKPVEACILAARARR
jgi:hypothetical protein